MTLFNDKTDEELFALLAKNAEEAFGLLYNRYWDKLLQVAFYKLRSQTDSEEAVQKVFVDIWNNRHQTVLKYTFRTYISAALKYVIAASLARKKRNAYISLPMPEAETGPFFDDSTRQLLDFNDTRDKLELVISQLPEKCELVFRLSREKGLTTKEISSELNISVKTVEGHVSKALKVIKIAMNRNWILDILLICCFYRVL